MFDTIVYCWMSHTRACSLRTLFGSSRKAHPAAHPVEATQLELFTSAAYAGLSCRAEACNSPFKV